MSKRNKEEKKKDAFYDIDNFNYRDADLEYIRENYIDKEGVSDEMFIDICYKIARSNGLNKEFFGD